MKARYWISASSESEREHLTSLGVKVGTWHPDGICAGEFRNCVLTDDAFLRLDAFWLHRYIWGEEKSASTLFLPSGVEVKCD